MKNAEGTRKNVMRALQQAGVITALSVLLGLLVNQTRGDGLSLLARWGSLSEETLVIGGALPVPIEEAERLFLYKEASFIDARLPELYAQGHITGALNLPSQQFEEHAGTLPAHLPKEALIIVYCDGELSALSWQLAMQLSSKGYMNVRVLMNGWNLWLSRELPIEAGPGPAAERRGSGHA